MRDSAGSRKAEQAEGTPVGSAVHAGDGELDRLRREQGELWQWVHRLERLAEAGLQARGLAHDLGNTLTSLMAGSELALQQEDLLDLRRALQCNLELSRTAARRLHTFVRYVVRGATDEEVGIRLPEIVEDAITFLTHPVRKAQVAIEADYASDLRVPGSRPELLQVVGTLLLAVIEGFGPAGGILEIRIEDLADEVVLQVRRASVAGSGTQQDEWWAQGSGLELTVSRRVVASLGGRLELERGAPTARLGLPVLGNHAAGRARREAPDAFAPHQHPAGDRARRA